jgi:signal transduction histidine kinase
MIGAMPPGRDAMLAAVLTTFAVVTLPGVGRVSDQDRPVDWIAALIVGVAGGAIAYRRRHPLAVVLAVSTATAAYLLLAYPFGPLLVLLAFAVWTSGRHCRAGTGAVACLCAFTALLLPLPLHPSALAGLTGALPALAWVAIPGAAGLSRQLVVDARRRERDEADRRLLASERLRVMHEVHDVVGHALAAIQMQADIALHVSRDVHEHSEGATRVSERAALSSISGVSKDALEELRSVLSTALPTARAPDRSPTPGVGRLERLVSGVEAAGTHVELNFQGHRRPLESGVDLVVYRVVQESLTNIVKHSAHPRAIVTLSYSPTEVRVDVRNADLPAAPRDAAPGPGLGTLGMRHRVERLGGRFRAGHDPGTTCYVVSAVLPTEPAKETA